MSKTLPKAPQDEGVDPLTTGEVYHDAEVTVELEVVKTPESKTTGTKTSSR